MLQTQKFENTPFARILPLFVAGILVAQIISAPLVLIAVIWIALYITAILIQNSSVATPYRIVLIFLTGILISKVTRPDEELPTGKNVAMAVEISETPAVKERWQSAQATVGYWREENREQTFDSSDISNKEWHKISQKIQLNVDTTHKISAGEQLIVIGYINPIDTTSSGYGALMRSRGVTVKTYITASGYIATYNPSQRRISNIVQYLQQYAIKQLYRLNLSADNEQLILALIVGEKRGLNPDLKQAYSKVGVAHILAVSGLHMGFVMLIMNILLGWVVLFRRGHIIKNSLVVVALWIYAAIAGFSPSVIRAALMLSATQIALGTSVRRGRYNIVLGAATLMLAVNPQFLFDVSFQLSFVAVLAILFIYPRIYRRKLNRNPILDFIWSSLLLGLAAQVGTMPLVAYHFGSIPIISIVINPLIIAMAFIAISFGIIWLIIPFGFLAPILGNIIEFALWVQNSTIAWSSTLPVASIGGVEISSGLTICIYALMLGAVIGIIVVEETRGKKLL